MKEDQKILNIIDQTGRFAADNDFAGYSKHDALNSPILNFLSSDNRWLRLLFIQGIMRFPVNLRPLFLTEKSRNPKGIALFAKGYLQLYRQTGMEIYKSQAGELLDWLIDNHSNSKERYSGCCWGYNFIWQSPFFYAPKYFPNITVTVFAAEALLLGYEIFHNQRYLDSAISAADFLLNDLPVLKETSSEKCLGYIPAPVSKMVININSMAATFLSKLFKTTNRSLYRENSIKLMNFVAENAIDNKKWTYTTDTAHSYVDNYHTGGIIDQMLETMENLDYWHWRPVLMNAVEYYREFLFTKEGAARNRDNETYPLDIHGAAQGIITFSKMSRCDPKYLNVAEKIFYWTIRNLYCEKGYFYYQKLRFFTKKFTLMRWCNSWMFYAMSELFSARSLTRGKNDRI